MSILNLGLLLWRGRLADFSRWKKVINRDVHVQGACWEYPLLHVTAVFCTNARTLGLSNLPVAMKLLRN